MTDEAKVAAAQARYHAAMHAVQSGVAIDVQDQQKNVEPKHLRVGVNSALIDASAVAKLLIDKGIITAVEYYETLADLAEAEKARYETDLSARKGIKITLA